MPLTAENRDARRTGIGASEIAAVCGLSPWRTPLDVYLAKVCADEEPQATGEDIERGEELEAGIRSWMARKLGLPIAPNTSLARHPYPSHSWCIATPDGYVLGPDGSTAAVVECKAPRRATGWSHPDIDPTGIPEHYAIQVQWQLAATSLDVAYVGALIHGSLWVYRIERSNEVIAALWERGRDFWINHVEARVPPPATGGDVRALARLFPRSDGGLVKVDAAEAESITEALRGMLAAQTVEREATAKVDEIKARICARIADAQGLDLGGGAAVTWKAARASRKTDWQALAKSLGATDEQIAEHTREVPGSRRFLVRGLTTEEGGDNG